MVQMEVREFGKPKNEPVLPYGIDNFPYFFINASLYAVSVFNLILRKMFILGTKARA